MKRSRVIYGALVIIVMILGLVSRQFREYLPLIVGKYSGDILWALMVYLGIGYIFRSIRPSGVAIIALIFSYAIELSQIYQGPWINSIRHTRLGGLVLGYGFLWSDVVCYTLGIGIGFIIESYYNKKP